jgi:hypothetical protein
MFKVVVVFLILSYSHEILALIESTITQDSQKNTCSLKEKCDFQYNDFENVKYILCHNFDSFSELRPECDAQVFQNVSNYVLHPNQNSLILNDEFDLLGLINLLLSRKNINFVDFKLKNLKGIDLKMFKNYLGKYGSDVKKAMMHTNLMIENSRFNFYIGKNLIDYCDISLTDIQTYFFSLIRGLALGLNTDYSLPICPYVFKNARLAYLSVANIIDHFMIKMLPRFYALGESQEIIDYDLNCSITRFYLFGYNYKFNKEIFNSKVFEFSCILYLSGQINSIETDLFRPFNFLSDIIIEITNMRNFIHDNNGLEWLNYMRIGLRSAREEPIPDYIYILLHNQLSKNLNYTLSNEYEYSDEDFCLFANFPHQKRVVPIIELKKQLKNCSCTLLWLLKVIHMENLKNPMKYMSQNTITTCLNSNFSHMFNACDFDSRISKCNFTNINHEKSSLSQHHVTNLDIHYEFYTIQYFFSIVLNPFMCLLGLVTNSLVALTTFLNRHKELKDKFFRYMFINSLFNAAYCLIYLFNLMSECILRNSLYCSSIHNKILVQYFKIIFVVYLGDVLKIGSNLTYILMIINRYMLVGKDHIKIFEQISYVSFDHTIILIIFTSLGLNVIRLLQYRINFDVENFEYPIIVFNNINSYVNILYLIWHLAGDVLNYLFYSMFTTIIDLLTVVKLRRFLAQKAIRVANHLDHKVKNSQKSELKGVLMVIINSLINFILRLPELSSLLYNLGTHFAPRSWLYVYLCIEMMACHLLIDISSLFYLISLSLNFLVYYFFNKKFKDCLHRMIRFYQVFLKKKIRKKATRFKSAIKRTQHCLFTNSIKC